MPLPSIDAITRYRQADRAAPRSRQFPKRVDLDRVE